MLQVTEPAAGLLKRARNDLGAPDTAGVRVQSSRTDAGPRVHFVFREAPETGDETVEHFGLRFFVASDVAGVLTDAVLDVATTAETSALTLRRARAL